jgi:hypothetical protein
MTDEDHKIRIIDCRARIEELEKALKPFAGAYDYYKLWHPSLLEDESASCMEYGHATIGHLRTAARALKP